MVPGGESLEVLERGDGWLGCAWSRFEGRTSVTRTTPLGSKGERCRSREINHRGSAAKFTLAEGCSSWGSGPAWIGSRMNEPSMLREEARSLHGGCSELDQRMAQ